MVLLSDDGCLELAYSGVDVPESVIEPTSEKVDYEMVESETRDYLSRMSAKEPQKEAKVSEEKQSTKAGFRLFFSEVEKSI